MYTLKYVLLLSSFPGVPQPVSEGDLICFSADDCHGELVPDRATIGDCCSSKGLSYEKLEGDDNDKLCVSCFRKFIRKNYRWTGTC